MPILSKARDAVTTAAKSVADAMKVAIIACILAVGAVLLSLTALARTHA